MDSKWWLMAGSFFAERDFKATAGVNIGAGERQIDFESSAGVEDDTNLFMGELGWQFGKKWGVALQHFRSSRSGTRTLNETFEWQDATYEAGARLDAKTSTEITRVFFSRRFRDQAGHSLRLGAGLHWLDVEAEVAGQATLSDLSTEFRRSVASAELPVPNVGAWYRYSLDRRWMLSARVDWLSASIDDFSGSIWNVQVGGTFAITDHFGIGAHFQHFELDGDVTKSNWFGEINTSFTGPYVFLKGYW